MVGSDYAQKQWEARFEGWKSAGHSRLKMAETIQGITDPLVTIRILDFLDDWWSRTEK